MRAGAVDGKFAISATVPSASVYTVYHQLEGRGFVCFVFYLASVHGPKPKHTKPLPPSG